jgi:hypothetical protein
MIRWDVAREHHAELIARSMRPRDIEEIRVGWGLEAAEAIRHALRASYFARVCFVGMLPLGIYGLSPICVMSQTAQVWIFGTRYIDTHKLAFLKASRYAMKAIYHHAAKVTNFIDANDTPANRWLDWRGGKVILRDIDRGGRMFHQFLLEGRCQPG